MGHRGIEPVRIGESKPASKSFAADLQTALGVVLIIFAVTWPIVWLSQKNSERNRELIRSDGAAAYRAGVPATANPYDAAWNGGQCRLWLEDWIEASEASK